MELEHIIQDLLSMVGLGDSAKQFFLVDPSFQCNLFTSSSGTNEIFTNLLYDLTPYHIYKKFFF